jgi:tetratricopeptide (TPR) repeat protein
VRWVTRGLATAAVLAGAAVPVGAQGVAAEWPALILRFEEQVARTPADAAARLTLAMLYAREGRLLEGFKQLQEADKAAGPERRGQMAREIVRDAEARVRRNPHDLLARYRLAFARYFLDDLPGAVKEFERIVLVDPRNDWGYGYLGQGYEMLGQRDRAIATWERGLSVNPSNAVLHYLLGVAHAKQGNAKKAAAHIAAAYRSRTLYEYVTRKSR